MAIIILLYNLSRERDRSRGRSREYKEKDRRHGQLHTTREERKSYRDHSRSREREQRTWSRESQHKYVIKYVKCHSVLTIKFNKYNH